MNEKEKLDELFILFDVYNHEDDQYSDNEHLRSEYERFKHKGFIATFLVGGRHRRRIRRRAFREIKPERPLRLSGGNQLD